MTTIFPHVTITEQDVKNIIGLEETISLEFKDARALDKANDHNKEIWKDVSSFANSGGGVLIYGISEKNQKGDSLSFVDGNFVTKEWLEQMIHSNIHRRIDGLKIDAVRFDNKIEQTVYVIQIPESANAPHMGKDNKYYRRYNFIAVAMEEYEVRNLYGRLTKTELEFAQILTTCKGQQGVTTGVYSFIDFNLTLQVKNISQGIELHYKVEIAIPDNLIVYSPYAAELLQPYRLKFENGMHIFQFQTKARCSRMKLCQCQIFTFV
jgi:hypothetical protein